MRCTMTMMWFVIRRVCTLTRQAYFATTAQTAGLIGARLNGKISSQLTHIHRVQFPGGDCRQYAGREMRQMATKAGRAYIKPSQVTEGGEYYLMCIDETGCRALGEEKPYTFPSKKAAYDYCRVAWPINSTWEGKMTPLGWRIKTD